jgi:GNAT superfamily N-acetyltransferase
LFEEAIAYQRRKNYNVWKNYDKDLLRSEVRNRTQYKIVIHHKTALIFSVVYDDGLLWGEREKGDSIYLHRIVVNPEFKGHRLFGTVLDWSIHHAESRDLKFIRMDTWADNENIIKYYESFGFVFKGNRQTPHSLELPIQHRGLHVALLELALNKTKPFNMQENKMLYMIIENFHRGKVKEIYQRFEEKGRLMPEGVKYVNSWIDEDISKCYQVMECDDVTLLKEWISRWNDLADFEIIPVITSAQAKEKVKTIKSA